jgi:TATA-binding protein-associated factor Taf7
MSDVDPIIGNWYRNQETGNDFEVVALDEDAQTIEIQYFDGELEELDLDAWYELAIESIEAPEDWSGPFDEMEADDLGYEEDEKEAENEEELSDEDDLLADRDED